MIRYDIIIIYLVRNLSKYASVVARRFLCFEHTENQVQQILIQNKLDIVA